MAGLAGPRKRGGVDATPAAPIFPQKLFGRLLRACAPSPRAPDKLHTCVKPLKQPSQRTQAAGLAPVPTSTHSREGLPAAEQGPCSGQRQCCCACAQQQQCRGGDRCVGEGREGAREQKGGVGCCCRHPPTTAWRFKQAAVLFGSQPLSASPPAACTTLPPRSSSSLPRPRHPTAAPAQLPLTMAAAAAGAAPLGRNILCAWRGWTS